MLDLFIDDIGDAVLARIESIAKSRGITAEELVLEAITDAANGWPVEEPPQAEPADPAKTGPAA